MLALYSAAAAANAPEATVGLVIEKEGNPIGRTGDQKLPALNAQGVIQYLVRKDADFCLAWHEP